MDEENIDWSGYGNLTNTDLTNLFSDEIDWPGYGKLTGPELAKLASEMSSNSGQGLSGLASLINFGKSILGGTGSTSDYAKMAALLGGVSAGRQSSAPVIYNAGYQGGIPKYTAARTMVTAPPAGRRPGSGGINYGGDVAYTNTGKKLGMKEGGLASDGFVIPADVVSHLGNGSSEAGLKLLAKQLGAKPIKGEGDGMSDSIPTSIDGNQPARVANEEAFVSPETVKRLGGGDTERGAKKLYSMMAQIRKARTGTKEQGKEIDPEKFMPGGKVDGYATGGTTGTTSGGQSLAEWVGPYVADMLGKGQALSEMPYQAYTGPLTAGESPLQAKAFGAASLYTPSAAVGQAATTAGGIADAFSGTSYTPGTFQTETFGTQQAQQYMNPFLESALTPQINEAKRQAEIARQANAARMAKTGAFGGGRQAIMESEAQRGLLSRLSDITGTGYATAYDKAQQAFTQDQARLLQAQQAGEASRQFGANIGMEGLRGALQAAQTQGQLGATANAEQLAQIRSLADLGAIQRGIESEGIAADKAQFEEARVNPYKMLQFQQSLLSGLPLAAQTVVQPGQSNLQQFAGGFTTVAQLMQALGLLPKETTPKG